MDLLACNLRSLAFFPTVRQTLFLSVANSNYIAKTTCVRKSNADCRSSMLPEAVTEIVRGGRQIMLGGLLQKRRI